MTPRLAAVEALIAIERGATTLASEIDRRRSQLADPRDQALFLELAAGTLRWRAALDAQIGAHSRRPITDLDPVVRAALRIAAFQLTRLDRVPAHALVNESVEIVRRQDHGRAAGFANAVLRALARGGREAALPARPGAGASRDQALDYLAITLSHPRWLAERWLDRYGFEATERWCAFNNASPEVTIRPAPDVPAAAIADALAASGAAFTACRFVRDAWRLPPGTYGRLPAEIRARTIVQDEASQLVAAAVGATSGERVLDLCAAPGGKTLILAADAGASRVIACDYRPSRVSLLRDTLRRAGLEAPIGRLNAAASLPFAAAFDRVFVDVPCSGLGTVRRDPDLKWSRTAGDLPRLAELERAILERAAGAVKPGGLLVYATCSSEPDENADVVARFLGTHPDFARSGPPPAPRAADLAAVLDLNGDLVTRPFDHDLDAFYAAFLVRQRGA